MSDPLYPLVKARAVMLMTQPFFGQLALRLKLKPMTDDHRAHFLANQLVPTMSTDGENIFFDLDFVASLDSGGLQTLLGHEVMHCVFEHIDRRGDRDPGRWNRACDHAVNLILKESGFQKVGEWLCDPKFLGMTAEQIYMQLRHDEGDDGETLDGQALCNIMDPGGDEAEAQEKAVEWQIAVTQSASAVKMMGKLPAHLERFVGDLLTPKVNWREVLRNFINARARDEYTWSRPNRMYLSLGFYAPGLYSEQMDLIVVTIDTSGSIDARTLNAFASEISGIRDAVSPKATSVIYCDSRVNHVDEFDRYDELVIKPYGGGGTDFRPPFKLMEINDTTPACFVYLTDGYGPFPEAPPPYPVLWCMTTGVVPPWGEHVRVEV